MAITDKTRKILWGRSGNRCAMCRRELVVERTEDYNESVVGDECHIISEKPQGPRYNPDYPVEKFDSLENLILLCRVHADSGELSHPFRRIQPPPERISTKRREASQRWQRRVKGKVDQEEQPGV